MTHFNKIKWILGIVLIFFVILTTNLIDRQNFNIVSDSIETIYADRLVAQDIIYDLTNLVGQKELLYATVERDGLSGKVKPLNDRIGESIELFSNTRLTPEEKIFFNRLRKELLSQIEVEQGLVSAPSFSAKIFKSLSTVREHLDELSDIQLQEGHRELLESKRAIGVANLFTQLEIAALIIMAIAVQVIILYAPKSDFTA